MTLHRAHLPGAPARNGLPPRRDYVYRGKGYDQKPLSDEQLAPYAVEYKQWLPGFRAGNTSARGDAR